MDARAFLLIAVVCVTVPGAGRAQPPAAGALPDPAAPPLIGGQFLPPYYTGPPGPYIGAPFVGYPLPPGGSSIGVYGFFGANRGFWPNGLSLYGPPVPVPGPIPGVFGNDDLTKNFRAVPYPGVAGYGYGLGVYTTTPRYHVPPPPRLPVVESLHPGPATPVAPPATSGGCVILSLRLPQPAADVFVNGQPTRLLGTDRIYKTPPVEAGRNCTFTVTARWLEHGQEVEMTKTVSGAPGEVVRVIFDSPGPVIRK
ncbi:TIGR03000 domain-containing protein [Frigoriglobus tundricola]|uniref:PEGA domain-containing protein n=1 Tax=Frigoriglobus tundricola TaxID=2774151 RepID=A0A6M5YLM8_9BACT|nr:TIGR03000 domain-containing protein [Frigoriglobus tundricola]QJW94868.1 hypothetical protein FTUN_2394 [Frigoriglobus tundricola]